MSASRFWRGPVQRYERLQRRQTRSLPPVVQWLWHGVLLIALFTAIALCGIELYAAALGRDPIANALPPLLALILVYLLPLLVLAPTTILLHAWLLMETLQLASHAPPREQRDRTWDDVLLTRQSVGQIVMGKWWAVVRYQLPKFLVLSILRFGVAVWLALESNRVETFYYSQRAGQFIIELKGREDFVVQDIVSFQSLALAGLLVILFTILNLGFTTAIGNLAGFLSRQAPLVTAFALRTAVVLLPALALLFADYVLNEQSGVRLLTGEQVLGFALIENGIRLSAAAAINPFPLFGLRAGNFRIDFFYGFYADAALLLALFYGVTTGVALRLIAIKAGTQD